MAYYNTGRGATLTTGSQRYTKFQAFEKLRKEFNPTIYNKKPKDGKTISGLVVHMTAMAVQEYRRKRGELSTKKKADDVDADEISKRKKAEKYAKMLDRYGAKEFEKMKPSAKF